MTRVSTVIVGAGQAGLALSRNLTRARHEHVVLERGRIGERWRSERWRSLALLTPNWLNRLPGSPAHHDADGFMSRSELVAYLTRYARAFHAPIAEGVTVVGVEPTRGCFRIDTDAGRWRARNVVVATGDCDVPYRPPAAGSAPRDLHQLDAAGYRSPAELPPGGVLVVGAGASGQQIAAELRRAGRDVVLAVGRHARMPRRYRGRDIWWWLAELGDLDRTIDEVADPAAARRTPGLPLSGVNGGAQLDLTVLSSLGVVATGRLTGFAGRHALFADDLDRSVADAERRMRRVLARVDEHVSRACSMAADAEPMPAVTLPPGPRTLDLETAGISTVLWATGYRRSYPWLHVPVLDSDGEIVQRRGATAVPGLYVLGLRFQHRRSSHFIGGVGADAKHLAALIATETRASHAYRSFTRRDPDQQPASPVLASVNPPRKGALA